MNQWNNEELRRRQSEGEVGLLRAKPPTGRGRWKALLVPGGVTALGFVLMYVGPLPGLGLFMFIGGLLAALMAFFMAWLGT